MAHATSVISVCSPNSTPFHTGGADISDANIDLDDYIYDFEVSIDGGCYRVKMPHSEMMMPTPGGQAYNDTRISEADRSAG